ncbi:MAG: helix-turn-helix domain-containing protein [Ktedonobacteraceae bacterium]|nr:helix-turn-helix domain-containing protein [Ktedonobacteraceae bacterium]
MGRTKNIPEGLYSAAQAIRRLGVPRSSFYDMVSKGKIEKIEAPHRSDGYYRKSQIDEIVRAKQLFILQYSTKTSEFAKATPDDALGIYDVGVSLWGKAGTPTVETRLEWYKSNPEIDYIVKQEGVVTGYISLMPLKHETIEQLMLGKKRGWEVTPNELLPFTPAIPLECFVMALGVRPGLQKHEKYVVHLFYGAIDVLESFAQKGIILDKFYATSNTPEGIRACLDFGFQEVGVVPGTTRKQFILDISTSNTWVLHKYKKAIKDRH